MKAIKQIKDYYLLREIGRGANGIVYEAVEQKANRLVAIKSIPICKLNNSRIMDQFKKELKFLYKLSNKNLIKILGLEKTVNNIYIVLENCNGGTLKEYLDYYKQTYKDRLPESVVQKIVVQIINGLRYMHKNNIIHRDIKMENILINFNDQINIYKINSIDQLPKTLKDLYAQYDLERDNFTIKIADLGYARELIGGAGASSICGSPMTIAPEILKMGSNKGKDSTYNSAIDLWSLGAVLYELLVGVAPFDGNSKEDVMKNIFKGVYEIPSNINISLESIYLLNGLLQFYPEKRLSWNEIAYHPFITKDTKKFKFIKLNSAIDYKNKDKTINNRFIIDSKDCSNFLWILFKASGASLPFELDKLDKDTYEEIMKDVLHNEISKEKQEDQHLNEASDSKIKASSINNFDKVNSQDAQQCSESIKPIINDFEPKNILNKENIKSQLQDNDINNESIRVEEVKEDINVKREQESFDNRYNENQSVYKNFSIVLTESENFRYKLQQKNRGGFNIRFNINSADSKENDKLYSTIAGKLLNFSLLKNCKIFIIVIIK